MSNNPIENSLNQVLKKLDDQQKLLEQLDRRLQNLENKLGVSIVSEKELVPIYTYPELPAITKATDFDTDEKRLNWWNDLEKQWQMAFNQAVLRKAKDYHPTEKEIDYILTSPILRLVGSSSMRPSIDFELTNLSGVKHLTNLTMLVVTHHQITNLAGIEYLNKLESLFVNANQIINLKEVHYLPNLTQLYCQDNQINDLQPLTKLTKLTTIYCNYNDLSNFVGITKEHSQNLKNFICLPNEKVSQLEIQRLEALDILCKKG